MRKFIRPLALTTALGAAGLLGNNLLGDAPPKDAPAQASAKVPTPGAVELKFAVDPKPLSEAAKNGLKYLANQQQADGGWNQGGGWRTGGQGRVENAADPSDVGNTCMALLAFIRAGNSPTVGEYKEHVKKALKFLCERVEKSDAKDLYVTDVRNTQLQSKIGPFVDTFLTTLVLSEIKGKGGDDEKRLVACLDKTVDKIAKNQKEDGTFAGNGAWAPVLSLGVCNKALARAKQSGVAVRDEVIARAGKQSEASFRGTAPAGVPAGEAVATAAPVGKPDIAGLAPAKGRAIEPGFARGGGLGGAGGDAGVPLYRLGQGAGNLQDVANSIKVDANKAREVLKDDKATKDQKDQAKKTIEQEVKVEKAAGEARTAVAAQAQNPGFVAGFGSNGGEEFLSFLNISEMLVVKADKAWADWDGKMQEMLPKAQDKDGSWSGHHCITGKTFCTAGALLVMMADRTPFPADVLKAARDEKKAEKK